MHRFFLFSENVGSELIKVTDAGQAHHLRDVLRLRVKEKLVLVDRQGREYLCELVSLRPQPLLQVKERLDMPVRKRVRLTIACCLPKNSDFDGIVDKLTQLGVEKIIPMESSRSIVRLDERRAQMRLERWKKIAQSASSQSQRNVVSLIEPVRKFKDVIREAGDYSLKLIPTLAGDRLALAKLLSSKKPERIILVIGPEGDFTESEVAAARDKGFCPVSLGDFVLRVETAAVASASFIMLYGQL